MTRLKVVAHLERRISETDADALHHYSLVVLQILTGRTHQIRTHMQHIGHPVVCDALYTDNATFVEDWRWCGRNFLHRYRLAFRESGGHATNYEAMQPLPKDLVGVL